MWPALPTNEFVVDRPAVEADVNAGRAVFVMRSKGALIGQPVDVKIPQYAFHTDIETGARTPCILIQAEAAGDRILAGVRYLDGQIGAGFLSEFELLGTTTPTVDA
jgi:hypothetical protein